MSTANDPHTHTKERETVHVVETNRSGGGASALWLILGAVIAALAIWFLVFGGETGGGTSVTIGGDAVEAVQGAAEAVEGAATAVEGAAEGN